MRHLFALFIFATTALIANARLGENEQELIKRFGEPTIRDKTVVVAYGKTIELGPKLFFKQGDWNIICEISQNRCSRISYTKTSTWTEDQFKTTLNANSQGATWTDLSEPTSKIIARKWNRKDGGTAGWNAGSCSMVITSPAFERAKKVAEEKAKADASRIPKI